jgi:hypothetical protein
MQQPVHAGLEGRGRRDLTRRLRNVADARCLRVERNDAR